MKIKTWLLLLATYCFYLTGCQSTTSTPTPQPTIAPTILTPEPQATIPLTPLPIASSTPLPLPSSPSPTPLPLLASSPTPIPQPAGQMAPLIIGTNSSSFGDLAVIQSDGSGYEQITTYGYNADPVLSPNQQFIAYRSIPASIINGPNKDTLMYEGYYNIWVIAVDGSDAWKLTDSQEKRSIPSWHSNNERVVFSEGENGRLVEVNFKTQTTQELAPAGVFAPVYQPDGRGIVYYTPQKDIAWRDETGQVTILLDHLNWLTYEGQPSFGLDASAYANQLEVVGFAWLPDAQTVFVSADVQAPSGNPFEKQYITLKLSLNGTAPQALPAEAEAGKLRLSPTGQYLAVHSSGYGDACFPGLGIQFVHLYSPQLIKLTDFTHPQLPAGLQDTFVYPTSLTHWLSDNLAIVQLNYTCLENNTFAGPYLLNLATKEMTQLAQLP